MSGILKAMVACAMIAMGGGSAWAGDCKAAHTLSMSSKDVFYIDRDRVVGLEKAVARLERDNIGCVNIVVAPDVSWDNASQMLLRLGENGSFSNGYQIKSTPGVRNLMHSKNKRTKVAISLKTVLKWTRGV